jgi:polysaccharide export outer membrane protein
MLLCALLACWACASSPPQSAPRTVAGQLETSDSSALRNEARIRELWYERTQSDGSKDFPIGPGDVLNIDVAGLVELEKRKARVAADGTIRLPLLGAIPVAGLTERELTEDLRYRLEKSVMYDPPVIVFVSEYRSRIVSVIGAVAKPGFYSLASDSDTILDVVAQAGGLTDKAAQRLYLIPVGAAEVEPRQGVPDSGAAPEASEKRHQDPLLLDLSRLSEGRDVVHLNLPVRPGDVITVPEKGKVLVKGWVRSPGGYEVTPELSVLGAISAAGGTRFAADNGAVKLVRVDEQLGSVVYHFDLDELESGEQLDIAIQSGDVIDVSHSATRWALWGAYELTTSVLGFGKGI